MTDNKPAVGSVHPALSPWGEPLGRGDEEPSMTEEETVPRRDCSPTAQQAIHPSKTRGKRTEARYAARVSLLASGVQQ